MYSIRKPRQGKRSYVYNIGIRDVYGYDMNIYVLLESSKGSKFFRAYKTSQASAPLLKVVRGLNHFMANN